MVVLTEAESGARAERGEPLAGLKASGRDKQRQSETDVDGPINVKECW